MARILVDVEQKNLYDRIKWDDPFPWPNPPGGPPEGGYVNGRNIRMYNCPSYPEAETPKMVDFPPPRTSQWEWRITYYLGVSGTDQFSYDGPIHINSRVRLNEVQARDGASHTFLVGERPPASDRWWGWWFAGSGYYPYFGAGDVVLGTEERIAVAGASTPTGPQSHYQPGSSQYESDGYGGDKHMWHFWSGHGEGAYFLFADGSVNFVPHSIDPDVFSNLGTYKGGEVDNGGY